MGVADRAEYRGLVREVEAFLGGDPTAIEGRIWAGLEDAARRLDFEKARRLQADIHLVQGMAAAQRRMRDAVVRHTLLLVLPAVADGRREVMLVIEGKRWAQIQASAVEDPTSLAVRLARAYGRAMLFGPPVIDHASLDDTLILNRWLFANAGHPAILPFDRDDPALDWRLLAERALGLSEADLRAVVQPPQEVADDPLAVGDADLLLAAPVGSLEIDDMPYVRVNVQNGGDSMAV